MQQSLKKCEFLNSCFDKYQQSTLHQSKSFFSPTNNNFCFSVEDFFKKLIPIFMNDVVFAMQTLNFDFVEYVLVKALIFFRDGKQLTVQCSYSNFLEMYLSEAGLKVTRGVWKSYANVLYKYILKKLNGDANEAVMRFQDILNLVYPILYLSMKLNEKIEVSTCFGISDLDYLTQGKLNTCILNNVCYF